MTIQRSQKLSKVFEYTLDQVKKDCSADKLQESFPRLVKDFPELLDLTDFYNDFYQVKTQFNELVNAKLPQNMDFDSLTTDKPVELDIVKLIKNNQSLVKQQEIARLEAEIEDEKVKLDQMINEITQLGTQLDPSTYISNKA